MSKSKTADQSEETISERVKALNAQMVEHAETGEWRQVTELMAQRNAILPDVPPLEQSSTYLSAQQCTQRVLTLAESARVGLTDQLSSIQRGRKAAASYRDNS